MQFAVQIESFSQDGAFVDNNHYVFYFHMSGTVASELLLLFSGYRVVNIVYNIFAAGVQFVGLVGKLHKFEEKNTIMDVKSVQLGKDVYERDLKLLREWLTHQQHLPQNIDDRFLKRFLFCCEHSLEKTKQLIDVSYTIRSQAPEIFSNRDPCSIEIQNCFTRADMVPLPKTTAENYKIFIFKMRDPDPENYHFTDSVKAFLMLADIRLIADEVFPAGEIPIFDMAGLSLRHLSKVSLMVLKKYMFYVQEGHPIRLKQIHVVNVSTFLDKAMALVKPFMKSEVSALLHFHTPNSNTLEQYIPLELLPQEYGGRAGRLDDLKEEWRNRVLKHRDYFLDESRWRVDEMKRPIKNNNGQKYFGLSGTFRSLNID